MFDEIKYCRKCGAKKSQNLKYCLHCGEKYESLPVPINNNEFETVNNQQPVVEQQMPKYCPKCGMEVIPEDKYCIECGYKKKYIYKPIDNTNNDIEFTEEKEPSILWIVLLVLAIINMIFFGLIAGLLMIVSFFVTLGDFTDGIGLFLVSGGYFAASVYAIKFCSKRTIKNKR